MERVELDDLIYAYPLAYQEGFQGLISAKQEFIEVGSTVTEAVPRRGQQFRHQKFLRRLMAQYDKCLVMWKTGTGKTCGVVAVTEYYKALSGLTEYFRLLLDKQIKRVYFLGGPALADEFKQQLICRCTAGEYETDAIIAAKTGKARTGAINKAIGSFYSIMTYGALAREVSTMPSQEALIEKYSGCIFIVDEVHQLYPEKLTDASLHPLDSEEAYDPQDPSEVIPEALETLEEQEEVEDPELNEPEPEEPTDDQPPVEKINKSNRDKRFIYRHLYNLFHQVNRAKILLLSATPMINKPSEMGAIMNLILPLDQQMPFGDDNEFWYDQVTLDQIEPYFRGMISYVRELDTGAVVKYQGEPIDSTFNIDGQIIPAETIVWRSVMEEFQNEIYKDTKAGNYFRNAQHASNFIFPDHSIGMPGFKKYVSKIGKSRFQANPELLQAISNMNVLKQLSCKFASIVDLCRNQPGNAWCYSDLIEGSGAIVLGLCLEAHGFEYFNMNQSVFALPSGKPEGKDKAGEPYCAPEATRGVSRKSTLKPGVNRYVLLTSEIMKDKERVRIIKDTFNSYENRHGDLIKVIIGSPVTQVGLSFSNVTQIHIIGPEWNQASNYQAESRAIRSTSHVDLIEEERARLRRLGENPDQATIVVNVYRHCAVTQDGASSDLHIYEIAETKDRRIRRIYRMAKQCAVDCQLNYERNVRPTDIPNSSTCDYEECNYQCFGPTADVSADLDPTSYDVLYSGEVVDYAVEQVKTFFKDRSSSTFQKLYGHIDISTKFVDMAVENIITSKSVLIDRYGYKSYLQEDNGILYLQKDFPTNQTTPTQNIEKYSQSYYTDVMIGSEVKPLSSYTSQIKLSAQASDMQEILQLLETKPGLTDEELAKEVDKRVDALSVENQVQLLEITAISVFVNGLLNPILQAILHKFRSYIFALHEPVATIKSVAQRLSMRGQGRGRKPKAGAPIKFPLNQSEIEGACGDPNDNNETVYIHNLYTRTSGKAAFNVVAKFLKSEGRIMVLKPSEGTGKWREVTQTESLVYTSCIQNRIVEMLAPYDNMDPPIYAIILQDKHYRIIDRTAEETSKSDVDERSKHRGKNCISWDKKDLIEICWKLGFNMFRAEVNKPIEEIIDYLEGKAFNIEDVDEEKLRFYYQFEVGATRPDICRALRKFMEETGRILVV